MIVTCRMTQCPYYDNRGCCAKPIAVSIDQMGMCSVLWRKGQPIQLQQPFTAQNYPRQQITIVDAEIVVDDGHETEINEEGESRCEDPQNGDTAIEQSTKT